MSPINTFYTNAYFYINSNIKINLKNKKNNVHKYDLKLKKKPLCRQSTTQGLALHAEIGKVLSSHQVFLVALLPIPLNANKAALISLVSAVQHHLKKKQNHHLNRNFLFTNLQKINKSNLVKNISDL